MPMKFNPKNVFLIFILLLAVVSRSKAFNTNANCVYFTLEDHTKKQEVWINYYSLNQIEVKVLKLDGNKQTGIIEGINNDFTFSIGEISKCSYDCIYTIKKGDSVIVSFNLFQQPVVKISNRRYNDYSLNFFTYLNRNSIGINRLINQEINNLISKNKIKLPPAEDSYNKSIKFTDSLLITANLNNEEHSNIVSNLNQYYIRHLYFKKNLKKADSLFQVNFINDRRHSFGPEYFRILATYAKSIHGFDLEKEQIDFPKLYDDISAADFSIADNNFLLYYCMVNINKYQKGLFRKYENKFTIDCKDLVLVRKINDDFSFLNSIKIDQTDLLISTSKQTMPFDIFLNKNSGKLIYIDIWASWCMPCVAEMPNSKVLQAQLAGKDIVFAYISIDENFSAWKNSLDNLKLNINASSLLLSNPAKSSLVKQLKINAIPRYLIYSRKGKLLMDNAPRPTDLISSDLLQKLLIEK
ncbi:MAG: TlpA family protein disulfide reductase [Sphingobacteriia bacterium]|nr:MAG: TlpA family protein disulfide reductase [Sphingobacteriia bacterium]